MLTCSALTCGRSSATVAKSSLSSAVHTMQVGCERHSFDEWWGFSDRQIIEMDGRSALEWWRKWKPILQEITK